MSPNGSIRPFQVDIPEESLQELRRRVAVPRWPTARPSPTVAVSALVGDASFACPALQLDLLTSRSVPTFAYEFNDDNAPRRFDPPVTGPNVATRKAEWPYLFDLPLRPGQPRLRPDREVSRAVRRDSR